MSTKIFLLVLVTLFVLPACGTFEISLYKTPTPIAPKNLPAASVPSIPVTETTTVQVFTPTAARTSLVSDPNCNQAEFIKDVTILDGTKLPARETFTKTWRLKNTGTCAWTRNYILAFMTGTAMTGTLEHPILADVLPGQMVDLSVELTAPKLAGKYDGYWGIKTPSGVWMPVQRGHNDQTFTVEIIVERRAGSAPIFLPPNCRAACTIWRGAQMEPIRSTVWQRMALQLPNLPARTIMCCTSMLRLQVARWSIP